MPCYFVLHRFGIERKQIASLGIENLVLLSKQRSLWRSASKTELIVIGPKKLRTDCAYRNRISIVTY